MATARMRRCSSECQWTAHHASPVLTNQTSHLTCSLSYMYRPHDVTRLAGLLHGGKVGGEKCNRVFQPHDAHIPHHLQFMCDYNLAGMGILTGALHPFLPFLQTYTHTLPAPTASRVMFRSPLPDAHSQHTPTASPSSPGLAHIAWHAGSVPVDACLPSSIRRCLLGFGRCK